MTGRGAWPVSGSGGTLKVAGDAPGPYYCLAAPGRPQVGTLTENPDVNNRAVRGGVKAIQNALNRENNFLKRATDTPLLVDGLFGPATKAAVMAWQQAQPAYLNTGVWGGVGPETAKSLMLPMLRRRITDGTAYIVCGIIQSESTWDPGAVGYVDDTDLGLAQINGPSHPDLSEGERLSPAIAIDFAHDLFVASLNYFGGDTRTAVASYNLGRGGASTWKRAGSPDTWTPPGSTTPRDVAGYINRILTSCGSLS